MPTVTIGQHVSVTGMVKEFDSTTPAVGDTLTEIANPVVTPVAGITTPLPLAGIAVATLKDISTVGEPYESVLVTLTNMKVMSNAVGNDRIQLSNGTDTIVMDDDVFNYTAADYPVNTCFGTVTGVMGLNTFDDERRIFPRSAADLVAGTSCP
jgi:predicted extracellular nuclease